MARIWLIGWGISYEPGSGGSVVTAYLTAPVNGHIMLVDDDDSVEFLSEAGHGHSMQELFAAPTFSVAQYLGRRAAREKDQTRIRNAVLRREQRERDEADRKAAWDREYAKENALYAAFLEWVTPNLLAGVKLEDDVTLFYAAQWMGMDAELLRKTLQRDGACRPVYWAADLDQPVYNVGKFLYWYYRTEKQNDVKIAYNHNPETN